MRIMATATLWFVALRRIASIVLIAFLAAAVGQLLSNFCYDRVATRVPLMG